MIRGIKTETANALGAYFNVQEDNGMRGEWRWEGGEGGGGRGEGDLRQGVAADGAVGGGCGRERWT